MTTIHHRVIEWSPNHQNFFASYLNSTLELYEIVEHTQQKVVRERDGLQNSMSKHREAILRRSRDISPGSAITSMNWFPCFSDSNNSILDESSLIATGTSLGTVNVGPWNNNINNNKVSEAHPFFSIYDPAITSRRQCTAVSWNRRQQGLLAAGFEKSRSNSEFCCAVWDIEHSSLRSKESDRDVGFSPTIFKPAAEEPTASLCWLPYDQSVLAVGTSISCVRLYDIRASNGSETLSILAHPATRPRKVKGIRPDPFNQYIIATFSDSAGEPIKLWDLRKGTSGKPKLTIMPHGGSDIATGDVGQVNVQSAVVDVAWSTSRSGVLAVATSHNRHVSFYSTIKTPPEVVTRCPIFNIAVTDQTKSLSWQRNFQHSHLTHLPLESSFHTNNNCDNRNYYNLNENLVGIVNANANANECALTSATSSNRLLVATTTGFVDAEVIEGTALSIGAGGLLGMNSVDCVSLGSISSLQADLPELNYDAIERAMKTRAASGYSIDAGKNLQVISDEIDNSYEDKHFALLTHSPTTLLQLYRVWSWVDRVESLHDSSISLTSCGVLDQLNEIRNDDEEVFVLQEHLGTGFYLSNGRKIARIVCGWSERLWNEINSEGNEHTQTVIIDIVEDCEISDSFERAAALALWHGDIELAVGVLQRNSDPDEGKFDIPEDEVNASNGEDLKFQVFSSATQKSNLTSSNEIDQIESKQGYNHLVSLVAMCIAGFAPSFTSRSSTTMWTSMCKRVLKQLESFLSRPSTCYLIAMCRFLLENLSENSELDKYIDIVQDDKLAMEDRIAFACVFMNTSNARRWLMSIRDTCKINGSLEGLILTGLSVDGFDILQKHLDFYSDIQTVALLVGRNIDSKSRSIPNAGGIESVDNSVLFSREWCWLQDYRNLLNRWQLFIDRASLDVELGKRNRSRQPVHTIGSNTTGSHTNLATRNPKAFSGGRVASANIDRKSSAERTLYTLPPHSDMPHIFLRCHFCSSSLPVDAMQQQQAAFLRKQKPILNCCPNCKKPLPRCYVCQLYMGLVNPHAEFNRALAQKRKKSEIVSQQHQNNSNHNNFNNNSNSNSNSNSNLHGSSGIDGTDSNMMKRDHNVLDFGRWFFFCQHCKHGGHAVCIDEWFVGNKTTGGSGRRVCGVNGCSCRCHTNR